MVPRKLRFKLLKKIKDKIIAGWTKFKSIFSGDFTPFYAFMLSMLQYAMAAVATYWVVAGMTVLFGSLGWIISLVLGFGLAVAYASHNAGEPAGVKWFAPSVFAFMALPIFGAMTGSLLLTLVVATGFAYLLYTVNNLINILRLSSLYRMARTA